MKKTALIYARRSLDREGRQQNTHITQLERCRGVAKMYNLAVLDEIVESASAKSSGTRKGFNKLLEYCESGKLDYVIIDEADRLSRDDIDTATFTTLLGNGKIEGIFVNGKEIRNDDPYAINMLWMQLGLSKLDNSIRSKKVQKNMQTALNEGKWLSKAVFGYRNVGDKKKRWIKVIEEEAKLVVEAFRMRSNQVSFRDIAKFLDTKTNKKWDANKVSKMIKNKKYYGVQEFGGGEAKIDTKGYRPLVSQTLFEKSNNIGVTNTFKKRDDFPKYLKGILKDTDKQNFYPFEKEKSSGRKYCYYHNSGRKSNYYVNINEDKIFKEFEKHIDNYNFPDVFQELSKATLKEQFKEKTKEIEQDKRETTKELNILDDRLKNLKTKWLDDKMTDKEYYSDKKEIENEIENQKEKQNAIREGEKNIIENIEEFLELSKNLATSYKTGGKAKKAKIIKTICLELILDNKKQLTIKENKLFEMIKSLNCNVWYSQGELNPCLDRERVPS